MNICRPHHFRADNTEKALKRCVVEETRLQCCCGPPGGFRQKGKVTFDQVWHRSRSVKAEPRYSSTIQIGLRLSPANPPVDLPATVKTPQDRIAKSCPKAVPGYRRGPFQTAQRPT